MSLLGNEIKPVTAPPTVGPGTQSNFFNALYGSGMYQKPGGGWAFYGMPQYPGTINPGFGNTLLPGVDQSYASGNPGLNALQGMQQQNWGQGTPNTFLEMLMQNGGSPGPGTRGMSDMMQWGSGSNSIANMLSNLSQFGAPNSDLGKAAGRQASTGSPSADIAHYLSNIAQFGTSGPAGNALSNLANGQMGGAAAYLAPWLTGHANTYASPTVVMPGGH